MGRNFTTLPEQKRRELKKKRRERRKAKLAQQIASRLTAFVNKINVLERENKALKTAAKGTTDE